MPSANVSAEVMTTEVSAVHPCKSARNETAAGTLMLWSIGTLQGSEDAELLKRFAGRDFSEGDEKAVREVHP